MAQANSKAKDKRPARTNYWNRRHLEKNKVCAMMKAYGLDEKKAIERWNAERKSRVPDRFTQDFTKGTASTHKNKLCRVYAVEEIKAFKLAGLFTKLKRIMVVR